MAYPKTYNPCDDCPYSFSKNNQESNMCKICEFKQLIDKPTADVVEVKHGEWKRKGQGIYCSVCGNESAYNPFGASKFSDYCPYCGAKMDVSKMERATERGAE